MLSVFISSLLPGKAKGSAPNFNSFYIIVQGEHMRKKQLYLCTRAITLLSICAAPSLLAQQLEEIIVTAERRETSLQDTPLSVLAFSSAMLEARGVETLEDLATNAPNLDIKGSRGTGNVSPTYQIRGISGGGGSTGERGVGFYLDGVFIPRQTGPYMQVLDLERIEILRGPQGTLFGRNSLGGAIRVFTKTPSEEKEGYVKVTGGNFDRQDISLMYNTPLGDNSAIRAQVASLTQDGYVERGPQSLGSSDNLIFRVKTTWDISEDMNLSLGGMYLNSESDGNPQDLATFDMSPVDPINGTSDVISFQGGYADWMSDFLETSGQPRLKNNDPRLVLDDYSMASYCFLDDADPDWDDLCKQVNENTYTQLDATFTWDINDRHSFTSVSGFSDFDSKGVTDWQLLGMERRPSNTKSETFYQELQLNSSLFDEKLDFISGLNYFHEKAEDPRNYLLQATGSSSFNAQAANGNSWIGGRITGDTSTTQESDSWGLFFNGTWHLTDMVNFTSGVRFAHDTKDYTQTEFASADFTPVAGTTSTTVSADDTWSETDWRATLDYQPTENFMAYITASKAYRAGSFAYTILDRVAGSAQSGDFIEPIPPEQVKNYEFGFRSELFDSRVRLNLTYFQMDYSDRQNAAAQADANAPTGFVIRLTNQGDVEIDGIELEAQFIVTDRFSIDASAGWLDTSISDVCVNNGIYLFPSPVERSYNVSGRYDFDLASGADLRASINYAYTGSQQTHPGGVEAPSGCPGGGPFPPTAEWFLDSRYELPGYGLLNARLAYAPPNGQWEVALFGNNLTDKNYGNFASRFGGGYWEGGPPAPVGLKAPERSALGVTRGRPRNYGLSFQYNFGGGR